MALGGCGSVVPARAPAPSSPPSSPPLKTAPAGEIGEGRQVVRDTVIDGGRTYSIDRDNDRLELAAGAMTASQRTCREPVALAMADRGTRVAVLCGRARVLDLYDASTLRRLGRAAAGIGATDLATDGARALYVTDAAGNALLVFRLHPFALIRRVPVAGGPYAIAFDREGWGLWIALAGTNQLVNYTAGLRPVLRKTVPSIRDARAVSVESGVVTVFSQDQRQTLRVRAK
jgi:hypothetical protein